MTTAAATSKKDPGQATANLNAALAGVRIGERGAPPSSRKLLEVDPSLAKAQFNGQAFAVWFVRLPQGMIADDLKEPGIWRRFQAHPGKALRRHDRVCGTAFDESWDFEAIVGGADARSATLVVRAVVSIPSRTVPLFSDDEFRVVWNGAGYVVERRLDGHTMTQAVATPQLAERDLRNLHPVRMGGR